MYTNIPLGPLTLPTGPILALIAVWIALDAMGRYGKRWRLSIDDLWNLSLFALTAGLIVARLWNVVQFWPVYVDQPLMIFSVRPGGFEFWPGVIAAGIVGYAYLIWRSLDPVTVAAALAFGFVAAGSILSASAYLTGAVVGVATDLPWGVNYFGKAVHAVGLYQAVGLLILLIVLWVWPERERPGRVVLLAGLGYGLIRLITDGFLADPATISGFRVGQVVGLVVALICAWGLGRGAQSVHVHDLVDGVGKTK